MKSLFNGMAIFISIATVFLSFCLAFEMLKAPLKDMIIGVSLAMVLVAIGIFLFRLSIELWNSPEEREE